MSKNIYQETDGLLYTELNISKNIPIHLSWWIHPLADISNSSSNLPVGLENISMRIHDVEISSGFQFFAC